MSAGQARLGELAAAAAEAEAEAAEVGDRLAALATEKELQAGGEVKELAAQADALAKQCALRGVCGSRIRVVSVAAMLLPELYSMALHNVRRERCDWRLMGKSTSCHLLPGTPWRLQVLRCVVEC